MVRFAHMSDCHLGSWSSHPDMKEFAIRAFETAIDKCISEHVDFVVIAGDLLDTSLPGIDVLKRAVNKFRQCKEASIPIYMIAGSHDYSPTGKTMLSVFENAGLVTDVSKYEENDGKLVLEFTEDAKTGCKLAGVFGKKGSLEAESFSRIEVPEENDAQRSYKIFVFHCGIDEHGMGSVPVSILPKNFNYYATGHIHIKRIYDTEVGRVAFPGPLFPTSFDELENYSSGFYLVSENQIEEIPVRMFETLLIDIDATGKTPGEAETMVMDRLEGKNLANTVFLLRMHGVLNGKSSDMDFRTISEKVLSLGAICMKKNISKLSSEAMEEISVADVANVDDLEKKLVAMHAGRMKLLGRDDVESLIMSLMNALKEEKGEDETNATFEEKIKENAKAILGL